MPGQGLCKKKRMDFQRKRPKRFFGVLKPPESRLVPSSEPMAPVPVPTISGQKIAREAPSTLTPLEDSASLHMIPCCGFPLASLKTGIRGGV